ncbi:epoxide hydrolase family protein [Amycolatopsis cihanbeyliensis]|uniref:Microsomal epoxide hydrolase n=1 Tax=Amycolatopsis cihanbeyliensis TaxID=1128664 RepID=A0A542DQ74_AMYCI|nr:epoxide hydrolase family protein [Amycolatopsis cihanbeyliensis]TQJ05253.1 microsomal epoxide hydrolase [Amycolatopsis cihanbeyliensis]
MSDILPFRVEVPQADIDELHRRIDAARWPDEIPGTGWERGVPLGYLKELTEYWRTKFDWRAAERWLNQYPQFTTEIDGANVHFLHVRSAERDATPLILTHGWPSSSAQYIDMIGPLTDPVAHGGEPEDAFHVVVPTIPGYGFSGPTGQQGWSMSRVARAWAELMRRLGYDRYVTQGGDWGKVVSLELGRIDAEHIDAVHINMLVTMFEDDPAVLEGLSEEDMRKVEHTRWFADVCTAWSRQQATRPQTLAYALTDSPIGQLAWITEKYKEWADTVDRPEDAIDRDTLLTIVSTYWFTATAGSSAHMYFETMHTMADHIRTWGGPWPISVPVGVAVFPADATRPIRRFAEKALPSMTRWTEFDRGGHFAPLEQPESLVGDIREFVRSVLRPS